jgi:hypothetical protein
MNVKDLIARNVKVYEEEDRERCRLTLKLHGGP